MPVITMNVIKLTKEQKAEIAREFTDIAIKVTGIPRDKFIVYINEFPDDNIGVGGKLLSDM